MSKCLGAKLSGHLSSGHFGTSAEVSSGHFGTRAEVFWYRSVLGPKCPVTDCGYKVTYWIISIIRLSSHAKTLINGLTTVFNCILLWNTSIWHNDVFYVHIIIYLKLQLLLATSTTCPVREVTSQLVDQSTRCLVCELAYPRVVQLPLNAMLENLMALFAVCIVVYVNCNQCTRFGLLCKSRTLVLRLPKIVVLRLCRMSLGWV